jgi:glutathione peroxidase-family protein
MEARLGEKLHGLSATALSGRTVDFSTYAGKPLLMVNVASC